MDYQIRMAPQVDAWLTQIRNRDPDTADRIDDAVAALRAAGPGAGPPLVLPIDIPVSGHSATPRPSRRTLYHGGGLPGYGRQFLHSGPKSDAARWLLGTVGFRIARPALTAVYRQQRLTFTRIRRAISDVVTSRVRLEQQIGQLEQQEGEEDDLRHKDLETDQGGIADEAQLSRDSVKQRLTTLRRHHLDMQADEERLIIASRRLQAELNAFQDGKEAIEAAHAAAEEAAAAAWVEMTGRGSADDEDAGSAADEAEGIAPAALTQGEPWLRELRLTAPESAGARILFTVEPPGTIVLLAAGTENDWLRTWYADAITLCHIRYQREQEHKPKDNHR